MRRRRLVFVGFFRGERGRSKGKGEGEHTLPQLARESLSAGQAVLVDTKFL